MIPGILSSQECSEAVKEIWDIIESVDNKVPIRRPADPFAKLSKEKIKEYVKNWVPYKSYGMLTEPPAFHTKTHWKLRQSEQLYRIFNQIY